MSWLTNVSLLLVLALPGCTTNSKSDKQAREAFAAGQRQGIAQAEEARRVNIRFLGPVRQPEIAWANGLTLAQAIAAAGYADARDPRTIVVIRQSGRIPVDPKTLLRGEDLPLEPGDTIEIHP
ncbi:MAG: hypothetical protein MUF81_17975 [Verrucomicrobia bacterium]|jgi:hypothetical protein|nr:hypothetical protein [Verrucomicrobiota bacterium]